MERATTIRLMYGTAGGIPFTVAGRRRTEWALFTVLTGAHMDMDARHTDPMVPRVRQPGTTRQREDMGAPRPGKATMVADAQHRPLTIRGPEDTEQASRDTTLTANGDVRRQFAATTGCSQGT